MSISKIIDKMGFADDLDAAMTNFLSQIIFYICTKLSRLLIIAFFHLGYSVNTSINPLDKFRIVRYYVIVNSCLSSDSTHSYLSWNRRTQGFFLCFYGGLHGYRENCNFR